MRRKRLVKQYEGFAKLSIMASLAIAICLIVWFIPPSNMILISLIIFLITILCFFGAGMVSRRIQIAVTLFIPLFFSLNLLVGFEFLNTVLLGSIIITGVGLLPHDPFSKNKEKSA